MVKGVSRRVIVVDSPDPRIFEQAIFILPTDGGGVSSRQLVDEAVRIARQLRPGTDRAFAAGGVRLHGCGRYGARVPAAWCGCWLRCCDRLRSRGLRMLYQLTFQRFPLFLPFHRGGCKQSPPQGSCFFSSLGADARRPPSFFTRRYRMPCSKKRDALHGASLFL